MISESLLKEIRMARPGYTHHWLYFEHGYPTMITARYNTFLDKNRSEKEFRQWHKHNDKWHEGVFEGLLPLYGLDSLHHESPFNALLILEGEACASLPHQLSWPSVTNCLGGNSVNRSDFSPLKIYKRFILLPDNDQTGIDFTRKTAAKLIELVPEVEIFVCHLIKDLPGGDLIDWVKTYPLSGHNWDGFKQLSNNQLDCVKTALYSAITKEQIPLEECSITKFKHEYLLFEGDPEPIEEKLLPVPCFPLHTLSEPIAEYTSLWAKQVDLPPDFMATSFLGIISGLIGKSGTLKPQRQSDWVVAANLFGVLLGMPSAKKSPALNKVYQLILAPLNQKAKKEYEEELSVYKSQKQEAKKNGEDFTTPEPIRRRFDTSDFTTPALKELLSSNPRGIIIRSDELAGVLKKLNAKGNESDRTLLLSGWSGDEIHHEDRITRKSNQDIHLTISWIGTIQPGVIRPYLAQALSDGEGNDGLMQRFQLITYPDTPTTYQENSVEISDELKEKIKEISVKLDNRCKTPSLFCFDQEAQILFDKWYYTNENLLRSETKEYWQAHLGKTPKLVCALAIQLHLLSEIDKDQVSNQISLKTLENSIELTKYYLAHAERVYNSIETAVMADARKIFSMIKAKKLGKKFKPCDIYRNQSGPLKDPERVSKALEVLKEYNIIALESYRPSTGRPGKTWIVHPKLH